jgi:hypothetical protein
VQIAKVATNDLATVAKNARNTAGSEAQEKVREGCLAPLWSSRRVSPCMLCLFSLVVFSSFAFFGQLLHPTDILEAHSGTSSSMFSIYSHSPWCEAQLDQPPHPLVTDSTLCARQAHSSAIPTISFGYTP